MKGHIFRASRRGDVKVIGMVSPSHKIEDIRREVPHGVTVTIPGELAVQSKDLWRGISQHHLFQLPSAAPPAPTSTQQAASNTSQLETQVQELSSRVRALEAENKELRDKDDTQTARKLDEILAALQERPVVVMPGQVATAAAPVTEEETVDGSAPMYLPDQIHPEDANVRIDVKGESATSDAVSAANALRKLRKKGH